MGQFRIDYAYSQTHPAMTQNEITRRFPNASRAFIQANTAGVCAPEPEPDQRQTLVSVRQREAESGARIAICFRCFAVRPLDADNYWTKGLQDQLAYAGIIHTDDWRNLAAITIETHKVKTQAEERTEIEISKA
jgi:hypothetical protein